MNEKYYVLEPYWNKEKNDNKSMSEVSVSIDKLVWWKYPYDDPKTKKHFDFEWEASIENMYRSKYKCPYIAGRKIWPGYNDFATWCEANNKIAILSRWDNEANYPVKTSEIPTSSKIEYGWKCEKGHIWKCTVDQMKGYNENLCPICSGRRVLPGVNDVKTEHPEIVLDWDYDKNKDKRPENYRSGSGEIVWWLCDKGHAQRLSISARVKEGCPFCKGTSIYPGYNDFVTLYPNWAKQWDTAKNKGELASNIAPHSGKKVWWKCEEGHSWKAAYHNRVIGNGCPQCMQISTSVPEQTLLFYLSKNFNCVSRDRTYGMEFDIFIPSIKVAVEYDGWKYHSSEQSYKKDLKKNQLCKEKGIKLYRFREDKCHSMQSDSDVIIFNTKYRNNDLLRECLLQLGENLGVTLDVDLERDKQEILSLYYNSVQEYSLKKIRPELAKEWHPTKNGKLTPDKIPFGSDQKVWWLGACGHEFHKSPNSRRLSNKCPLCVMNALHIGVNDLASAAPEVLDEWDYDKNSDIFPDNISVRNSKKVWWICKKCGHNWQSSIGSRTGKVRAGCPECAKRKSIDTRLKGYIEKGNSLALKYPDISKEWDYVKNASMTPSDVLSKSEKKVWWICSKGHEYKTTICARVEGKKCPYCANRKILLGFNDLKTTHPELAKEWDYEKNIDITPEEVTYGSGRKIWWICPKGHSYEAKVSNRARNKCPYCTGRSH